MRMQARGGGSEWKNKKQQHHPKPYENDEKQHNRTQDTFKSNRNEILYLVKSQININLH